LPVLVKLPRALAEAIRERGLDPESFVLEAVTERLYRDPEEGLEARLEVARHMLERAREELSGGTQSRLAGSSIRRWRGRSRF